MPINYLDYQRSVPSAFEMAMAGYQQGLNIKQERQKAIDLENKKASVAQMQADLANFARNPNPTAQQYNEMLLKYPDVSDQIKAAYDSLETEEKEVRQGQALTVFTALSSGNADVAKEAINRQIAAAENSGDEEEQRRAEMLLQLIETDPNAAKVSSGLLLSHAMGGEKFADIYSKLGSEERAAELQDAVVKKHAAELGLTEANTKRVLKDVEKLDAETKKLVLEIEAGDSVKDPEKIFNLEQKLRSEYSKETQNFNVVQEAFRRVDASQDTAAGDLSLIFSYMKMLDPGSVVREGEFATAQNAAGVPERVVNLYNNLLTGERLNPNQRNSFRSQANSLFNAALAREKEVRSGLTRVINSYGLNADNVFFTESPSAVGGNGGPSVPEGTPEELTGRSYLKYSTGE